MMMALSFGSVRNPSHPSFAGIITGFCIMGTVPGALLDVLGALPDVPGALVEPVGVCFDGGACFVTGAFVAGTFTGSCAWIVPAIVSRASDVSLSTIVLPPVCGEAARAASRARPAPQDDRC